MIKMSLKEASEHLKCTQPTEDLIFQGVSTDTRTLQPGNLFVAICGEQYNGHDFITEALKKGAIAALVSQPCKESIPQLMVNDTLEAFGKLSAIFRSQFTIPIIGVTGSNGKTTLKNMIASILQAACNNNAECVLATEGNLNNNIGVPIMLCRLNSAHRYAVIEMGMNHFHEIEYLTKLTRPKVAVITNAAEAHLEGLKNIAGVAKAKGEIFQGLPQDGVGVLNRDDPHYTYWLELVKNHRHLIFGLKHAADVTADILQNQHIRLKTPTGEIEVNLPLLGKHNVMNALAATAATLAIGIDLPTIKAGLESVDPAHGRMEQHVLKNGTKIIDDTYNANPFSLRAAVDTLSTFPGEKIVVLGDMKELGKDEIQLHAEAGHHMREAGINSLFTFGKLSEAATESFGRDAMHFTDRAALIAALQAYLKPDTTILIKGSRSMRMETILAGLIPENKLEHTH
jgi:UDP-N-acetylmuramoyl-tripeptide--D-alanyl-D-alanine ligase